MESLKVRKIMWYVCYMVISYMQAHALNVLDVRGPFNVLMFMFRSINVFGLHVCSYDSYQIWNLDTNFWIIDLLDLKKITMYVDGPSRWCMWVVMTSKSLLFILKMMVWYFETHFIRLWPWQILWWLKWLLHFVVREEWVWKEHTPCNDNFGHIQMYFDYSKENRIVNSHLLVGL
jgi:hypothetical protein